MEKRTSKLSFIFNYYYISITLICFKNVTTVGCCLLLYIHKLLSVFETLIKFKI